MIVNERSIYKKYTRKEIKRITPDMYNDIYLNEKNEKLDVSGSGWGGWIHIKFQRKY